MQILNGFKVISDGNFVDELSDERIIEAVANYGGITHIEGYGSFSFYETDDTDIEQNKCIQSLCVLVPSKNKLEENMDIRENESVMFDIVVNRLNITQITRNTGNGIWLDEALGALVSENLIEMQIEFAEPMSKLELRELGKELAEATDQYMIAMQYNKSLLLI